MADIIGDDDAVVLPGTASVQDACLRMRDRRVGATLVIGPSRRLVGIFTGRDAVARVLAEGRDAATTPLVEVMTRNPKSLPPTALAVDGLRLMDDGGFSHLPVCDGNRILGIVSRRSFGGQEQARLDEDSRLKERIW